MNYHVLLFFLLIPVAGIAQTKPDQGRQAIKSMCGCYEAEFRFTEAFSPDRACHFHEDHHQRSGGMGPLLWRKPKTKL